MPAKVKIIDESGDKKYFILTPRIVIAHARSPYDLMLWNTVKDIAGEEGECYLATPELATLSKMSTGQVSESRKYWMKLEFLLGDFRRDPGYPQSVWHLRIPDLWKRNIEWCEKNLKISDRLEFAQALKSLHYVKPSPGDGGTLPGETKNTIKDLSTYSEDERTGYLAKLYQDNIGMITPILAEKIKDAAIDYPNAEWYAAAFGAAVENNARSWNYVSACLKNRKEKGPDWKPAPASGKKPASKSGESLAEALQNAVIEE